MPSLLDLYNMRDGEAPKASDLLDLYRQAQAGPSTYDRLESWWNALPPGTMKGGTGLGMFLLQGAMDDEPIVERGAMLPVGYHEDGSMEFAWPKFITDAVQGAQRSLVAQEGPPLFDDGGEYVSGAEMQPLDPFMAASIAPMAVVATRAAGMTPNPGGLTANEVGIYGTLGRLKRAVAADEARRTAPGTQPQLYSPDGRPPVGLPYHLRHDDVGPHGQSVTNTKAYDRANERDFEGMDRAVGDMWESLATGPGDDYALGYGRFEPASSFRDEAASGALALGDDGISRMFRPDAPNLNVDPRLEALQRPFRLNANDSRASLPGVIVNGDQQGQSDPDMLQQFGLLENPDSPQPQPRFRMRPPDDMFEEYNNEQLYRGVPRDQIPPNMRPPLDAPGIEPVFPGDRWRRLITQR